MKLEETFDPEARCFYFKFSEEKVNKTIEIKVRFVTLDYDSEGRIIGIELGV